MTNVPNNIREMWTDLYKQFDIFYAMKNTEADWKKFWDAGRAIWEKHGKPDRMMDALVVISDVIADRMKKETV